MTVIAWDGRTLAADCMSNYAGSRHRVSKLRRFETPHLGSCIGGGAGDSALINEHFAWLIAGGVPSHFPHFLRNDATPSVLMVVTSDRRVWSYEDAGIPVLMLDPFFAIGSGRNFALAAMHLRFSAVVAVETACALSTSCGVGVDTMTLEDGPNG